MIYEVFKFLIPKLYFSFNWGTFFSGGIYQPNNKKKKNDPPFTVIEPRPYTGQVPYSGSDLGFDSGTLKGIADAYRNQITERSQGRGVGFASEHRGLARDEYLKDFGDYSTDILRKASQQASAQGLRGGIPSSIGAEIGRNLSRSRQSGLAQIDIADLEAARQDQNQAIYAQPDFINQGNTIQQNRAAFDLNQYNATQPTYIENPQQQPSGIGPALIQAAGTIGGAYFGGPPGAAAGNAIAKYLTDQNSANKSVQPKIISPVTRNYNYYDPLLTSGGYGYRKPY